VSTHLSVRYGVRYNVAPAPSSRTDMEPLLLDVDALPTKAQQLPNGTRLWNTSWRNVAPHLAATYQFGAATGHETTVRAGWNLVFDDVTAGAVVFGRGYPYATIHAVNPLVVPIPDNAWNSAAPEPFTQGDRNTYFAFPRDLKSPRTYNWQVGVDQAIGQTQHLGLSYVGAAGRNLTYWYGYNSVGGSPAQANAFSNDGSSDYHALLAEYVWRLSRGLQAQVGYTWGHAIDVDSGETLTPNPPPLLISPRSNRASADFDRRHVLQAVASYQFPRPAGPRLIRSFGADWQVDAVVAIRSGAPVTVTASRDIGFGQFEYRPDVVPDVPLWIPNQSAPGGQLINREAFIVPTESRQGTLGRNTLRASPLRQVDLGLSRSIRLGERVVARLRLDAFNVFNIPNFGPPAAEWNNEDIFGRPIQSYASSLGTGTLTRGGLVPVQQLGGPRSVQVGVRFTF
jgi:hypothetical protein